MIDGVRKEKERLTAAKLLHGPSFLLFIGSCLSDRSSGHYLENRSWLSDELWITVLGFLCFKGKHRSNTSETASNYPFNVLRLTSLFVKLVSFS